MVLAWESFQIPRGDLGNSMRIPIDFQEFFEKEFSHQFLAREFPLGSWSPGYAEPMRIPGSHQFLILKESLGIHAYSHGFLKNSLRIP